MFHGRSDERPSEGIPPVHHRTRVVRAPVRPDAVLLGVRGGHRAEPGADDPPVSAPARGQRVVARAAVVLRVRVPVHVRVRGVFVHQRSVIRSMDVRHGDVVFNAQPG